MWIIIIPKSLVVPKSRVRHLRRGKYDYRSKGPVVAYVWKDRRIIYFLSTIHVAATPSPTTVQRTIADGTWEDVNCPPCLPDYQTYMRGVDRGDQLIGYYNIGRRSKKWWKRVFSYLVEVCVLNAYVFYKHAHEHSTRNEKFDYLGFRLALVEGLVGSFHSRARVGRPFVDTPARLDASLRHLPMWAPTKIWCVLCL